MEKDEYLDVVRSESARLVEAVRAAGTGTAVPTCPSWTTADLLAHVSGVHGWVRRIVSEGLLERPSREDLPTSKVGDDPVGRFEEGAAALLGALEATDGAARVWNWFDRTPAPAAFWFRRMAHETAMHRVDAEAAAGWPSVMEPPGLAADGIDEILHFLPVRATWQPDSPLAALRGSYHFHATDTSGEWTTIFAVEGIEVSREHTKGDVAVRGPAGALELFVYNRGSTETLEIHGDAGAVTAWQDAVSF